MESNAAVQMDLLKRTERAREVLRVEMKSVRHICDTYFPDLEELHKDYSR